MGTRGITLVFDDSYGRSEEEVVACIYGQYDGYFGGMGQDLKDRFGDFKIVNGISERRPDIANGMGCFAASLVAALKATTDIGGIYLRAPEDKGEYGYVYELRYDGPLGGERERDSNGAMIPDPDGTYDALVHGSLRLTAKYDGIVCYDGLLSQFDPVRASRVLEGEFGEEELAE